MTVKALKKRTAIAEWLHSVLPRNSVKRVVVTYLLILAVLMPPTMTSSSWPVWTPVTHAIALVAGGAARMIGVPAVVTGHLIALPTRTLSVDPACTAFVLFVVFASIVLAYPVRWSLRLIALLLGAIVLQAFNIARLVAVAWAAGVLSGSSFAIMHDYLFEVGMVFVVIAMWAVWLSVVQRTK